MQHKDIPGYQRALRRGAALEERWRELAFLNPAEKLCGVTVRYLSLRMFAELCAVGSPFLCGGSIGGEHVFQFLWRLSPKFSRTDLALRDRFAARIRELAFDEPAFRRAVRQISRFIDRMMLDRPPSSGGESISDCSFIGALEHEFARSYGWSSDQILDKPLPQLFQLLRQIQRERNPKLPKFNRVSASLTRRVVLRYRARVAAAKEAQSCPAKS